MLTASFYIMIAMLVLPYLVAFGGAVKLLKVDRMAGFLLVPSALLGFVVADLWLIGDGRCFPLYRTACEAIVIVGWIFYLPVFAVLLALSVAALGLIVPATMRYWRGRNGASS
ncbi:MAG: hypothetical protein AAGH90_01895 [Pseudomonadota bacterium]